MVCAVIALGSAGSALVYGDKTARPYDPDTPVPPVADAESDDTLGNGVLGQLAFAVREGGAMALLEDWEFAPDREITVSSIVDLGEFAAYAPPLIGRLELEGTAYIQGSFSGNQYDENFVPGLLVYQLKGGPVVWVHTTEAWLDWIEHPGDWRIHGEELYYMGIADEVRYVIGVNSQPGDNPDVYGLAAWGMQGQIGQMHLRTVYPDHVDMSSGFARYDIWLAPSRVKELLEADTPGS